MHHPGWPTVCLRLSWLVGCLFLFSMGCIHTSQTRMQSEEENERDKDLEITTIGEVTEVSNVAPIQVSGVGLVTGLSGTGGTPPGTWRTMLEMELRKQKVENTKQLLDSPNNALVLVSAMIPAGAHKNDTLDLEVTLPPGSKATSLRGGQLQPCALRNYESTRNLNPETTKSDKLLQGHILAHGRGTLLVGLENGEEPAAQRRARIWEGGVSLIERPVYLSLKRDRVSRLMADGIADRFNQLFNDDTAKTAKMEKLMILNSMTQQINHKFDGTLPGHGDNMAKAMSKEVVAVRIPHGYRYNIERYLRVVRLIPLRESQEQQTRYRQRLQKMLVDPADTIRAALRLEALGRESLPTLKQGLKNEHPLVRFATAEALAYLGNTAGVEELANLAVRHGELRAYALTAMASLNEAVCHVKLEEMLTSDNAELRCGAFRALCLIDAKHSRLKGEFLNESFWLHRVAPQSSPMVYFAVNKRAEIICFGEAVYLETPVKILAGPDFTVTAEAGDKRCTVSHFHSEGAVERRQCSLRLDDVLRTMAELGAQYPDALDLLRKADDRRCLSCGVRVQTLPQDVSVETLAQSGRDPNFLQEDRNEGQTRNQ